jgi:chemotaxis protein MotB
MMRRYAFAVIVLGSSLLLATGCVVGKKKYEAAVRDLDDTRMALAKTRQERAETRADLESRIGAYRDRIEQLEAKKADLEQKLSRAKSTLQMYETKKGKLQDSLQATKEELEKLRKEQARQRERLERYRQLAERLANMFQSDELSVKVRDGKMMIEMQESVLFDSGRARVKDDGRKVLKQLASVLQEVQKREFLVAGHTDDVPIDSQRFSSNWELSTARAVNVVQLLQENGVPPKNLSAAGYSKYDPVATNETQEGRSQNRRIEVILMPRIDELPELPKDLGEGSG